MSHTPGPWMWTHDYGDMCDDPECPYGQLMGDTNAKIPYMIMEVHGWDIVDGDQDDAHLIATAPELLEAAEALFVNATPWMLNKISDSEAGTMLEAAIKKARGEV